MHTEEVNEERESLVRNIVDRIEMNRGPLNIKISAVPKMINDDLFKNE
jgi:hypothetical protein